LVQHPLHKPAPYSFSENQNVESEAVANFQKFQEFENPFSDSDDPDPNPDPISRDRIPDPDLVSNLFIHPQLPSPSPSPPIKDIEKEKIAKAPKALFTQKEKTRDSDYFYFYQASEGEAVYIAPCSAAMLIHEFREYENFPPKLNVKIIHIDNITVTEVNRKRYKFLGHLALNSAVQFAEVDLKTIVSPATIAAFEPEIQRRVQRREKLREKDRLDQLKADLIDRRRISDLLQEKLPFLAIPEPQFPFSQELISDPFPEKETLINLPELESNQEEPKIEGNEFQEIGVGHTPHLSFAAALQQKPKKEIVVGIPKKSKKGGRELIVLSNQSTRRY